MQADFVLDYDVLTLNESHKINLMARFVSGPAQADRQRRPLNISLVIDRSGSMAGDKIDYTRQAAQMLVQNLGTQDVLSVVLYNDKVETLLAPESVQRKDVINQRLATIKPGGTTNLSSGWLEACKLVAQNLDTRYLNRVILMSDGLANRGVTDSERLVSMMRQKFEENISTTTMGLGTDFNEDLLMALATAGGGAFYFIESPEVAPTIFREELQGLLNVVGQNLLVSVQPSAQVNMVKQLNAYPEHSDGRQTAFRMGDVFGDEIKALLLELNVTPLKSVGEIEIATLRFEYDELKDETTQHHVIELPVKVRVEPASGQPLLPKPEVENSVLLLKAAQSRQRAIKLADRGEYKNASQILLQAASMIEHSQSFEPELLEEKNALVAQAKELERGDEHYGQYSRKTMSTQAFYTMTSRHQDTMMLRVREQQRSQKPTNDTKPKRLESPSIQVEPRKGVTPTQVTWNDKTFVLQGDLMRVGRSKHNEIGIAASGVSRFHCQIRREGDKLYIEDLGSTNGTMIDGELIEAPHPLSVGDVAYLCDEKLIFHDGK
jgi:Ca-activated chloride channel homolog